MGCGLFPHDQMRTRREMEKKNNSDDQEFNISRSRCVPVFLHKGQGNESYVANSVHDLGQLYPIYIVPRQLQNSTYLYIYRLNKKSQNCFGTFTRSKILERRSRPVRLPTKVVPPKTTFRLSHQSNGHLFVVP